ncbi:MAG: transcriptional repressor NrdR [Dehalococcoidia bacterium]|nr:MAG: transcriptional repressor NrdR [Dehalococcoidia bacterium]
MKCPYCGFEDSKVTDSRAMEGGIRRRRECLSCGQRFTTAERVELAGLVVVKKDGRREEFSRDKLLLGVRKACEKRPIPQGAVEALVDDVETQVHAQGKAEVPTTFVGELVIDRLRDLDEVAYIRFASVYRAFRDVDDLKEELAVLERNRSQPAVATAQLPLLPAEALEGLSTRLQRRRARRSQARASKATAASGDGRGRRTR